jgi:hypothetical protein
MSANDPKRTFAFNSDDFDCVPEPGQCHRDHADSMPVFLVQVCGERLGDRAVRRAVLETMSPGWHTHFLFIKESRNNLTNSPIA